MVSRPSRWRRVGHVGRVAVWVWTATVGTVACSQALGFTWIPLLYVLQALTPYLFAPSVPIALLAAWRRRHVLTAVHTGVVVALAVLAAPLLTGSTVADHGANGASGEGGPRGPAAQRFTIGHANAYFRTDRPDDAAAVLLALDVDVLAVTEYSTQLDEAWDRAGGREAYPHTVVRSPVDRNGIALHSRHPIVDADIVAVSRSVLIDATLSIEGTPVRIVVAHPLPALDRASYDAWSDDLADIDALVDPDPATVLVGDFNASWWHPPWRSLVSEGWVDAHQVLGRGRSMSWPTGALVPPFVRIDHALLGAGVVAEDVRDLEVPGSDHRAFVLDVALVAALEDGV